jgi:phenylalanyl-tRNA synthetase beta chain
VRVPLEWLREFVVMDVEPHELASKLTMRGLEVEAVEEYAPSFRRVCVGEIIKIDAPPKGTRLSLCTVNTGVRTVPVVCGASNIREGDRVPVALPGAQLADGTIIEQRMIRGVESTGMLCSEKELGISDDHSGIFILPENFEVGEQLDTHPDIHDFVFDVNVPPNRGDCLSILGIAREVGSIFNQKAKLPQFKIGLESPETVEGYVDLEVVHRDACPRYVLKMIKGVSVVPSPYWMRSRILKCSMRPINAIVDVTNYVMLELGQPLHSFDYGRLRGKRIVVRLADGDMEFRTLDGTERALVSGDLLICDGAGPVAVAGVMGGENSEITAETTDIALESAYFNPYFIRRTARRLNIRSEASLRFEKGIDLDNVEFAGARAIELMSRLAGGKIIQGKREIYEKKQGKTIFVDFGKVNGLLGTTIDHTSIINALRSVDLHIMKEEESGFTVSVPNFRHDLDEYTDIIEEVGRIYGYDHIPPSTPVITLQPQKRDTRGVYYGTVRDYFRSAGFFESINFAFFGLKDIGNFHIQESDHRSLAVPILNPLSKDYEVMRTFMTPHLLKTLSYNLNRGAKNQRLYEMGKVFVATDEGLPSEYPCIGFAMTGQERDYFWRDSFSEYDFFDIKGVMEGLLGCFDLSPAVTTSNEPFLNLPKATDIFIDGVKLGWMGEIGEEVLRAYDIEQRVYCAELRFDRVMEKGTLNVRYRPIPRYPQATRDFSFYMDDTVAVSTLMERVRRISPLIVSASVFDMFRRDMRSVAFRVVFQSFEQTLRDEEINGLQETIIKELSNIKGVRLRT